MVSALLEGFSIVMYQYGETEPVVSPDFHLSLRDVAGSLSPYVKIRNSLLPV